MAHVGCGRFLADRYNFRQMPASALTAPEPARVYVCRHGVVHPVTPETGHPRMLASALSPVFAATVFRPKQLQPPPEEQRAGQASYARASQPPPQPTADTPRASARHELDMKA